MKKIGWILLVVLLLIGGGLFYVHSNLDSFVKAAIEKYGTQAVKTDVRVTGVTIALTDGKASINGLTVANPAGFSAAKALSLGMASVALDTGSVTGGNGPVIIREIIIDKTEVNFEGDVTGSSNLQALQRNISAKSPAAAPVTDNTVKPTRKVIINDLYVRNGSITISHPLLRGKTFTAALPEIHLTNIGKSSGGATTQQVADQLLASLLASAEQVARDKLAKQALRGLGDKAGALSGTVNGLLNR